LERKRAYYSDTDSLDYELYKTCDWRCDVLGLLEKTRYSDIEGLLSEEEIEKWNNRVLNWFENGESKFMNETRYISMCELACFIKDTSDKIEKLLGEQNV